MSRLKWRQLDERIYGLELSRFSVGGPMHAAECVVLLMVYSPQDDIEDWWWSVDRYVYVGGILAMEVEIDYADSFGSAQMALKSAAWRGGYDALPMIPEEMLDDHAED